MRRPVFTTSLPLAWLLLTAATGPSHGQQDTSWQIYLDRPAAVGDRCSVSSTGSQTRRLRTNLPGQMPEDSLDTLEISYAATQEVLAVGKNGQPVHVRITVEKLETNDGSGPQQQFTPGTVLEATSEGDETHFHQGRDLLEGTLADALNLAGANLGSTNEPSEDAVFQNSQPVRPGTKLPADPRLLARAITLTTPFMTQVSGTSGELFFDKATVCQDIPALSTESKFNIALKGFKSSPDRELKESFIRAVNTRVLPIDPSLPLLHETLETDMRISTCTEKEEEEAKKAIENGEDEEPGFTTVFHRKASREVKPLPPAGKPS
ncbi:MAG: hypothetical protein EOP86_02125 [Verrucomicrobiaceae bacterium]|nr:MAG: hypothetical protein EOP86_02125 [Verrucomicrobiaceae bacterium]